MPQATTAPQATSAATSAPPVAKAVTLQLVKNDQLGSILADGDGNILYLFTKDTPNVSNCYDKCLAAWPAVYPAGQPTLKEGLSAALVGTTTRKDGSTQLTYNGWPLYYYEKDKKPGDVTGQAVGKVWWVISGEGNAIRPASMQAVANDKLGKILADGNGMTLYMFTKDTKDTTNCYDKCEVAWPPLLSVGKPTLGDGVDASLLGTTTRKDGTVQVTYNGMPLYYYLKDTKPGDVTGQNVGKVWFVVAPDGTIVKAGS
jgi:predicted lipoprotein with Yx(FWY)xxD motif